MGFYNLAVFICQYLFINSPKILKIYHHEEHRFCVVRKVPGLLVFFSLPDETAGVFGQVVAAVGMGAAAAAAADGFVLAFAAKTLELFFTRAQILE